MATTNMTMRVDENLKSQADELFSDLGMNMTTAVTIFLKQALREQGIPFSISRDVPNEVTRKAIEDTEKGIGLSRGFSSVSELMEDLNADD
jgi:DNA-damage-inducible protein J